MNSFILGVMQGAGIIIGFLVMGIIVMLGVAAFEYVTRKRGRKPSELFAVTSDDMGYTGPDSERLEN